MASKIAIIDYGSGNLHSAFKAVKKAAESKTGSSVILTSKPEDVDSASHIILPGVGAFQDCMDGLHSINGMIEALSENVMNKKKNFLGICVGMQLLAEKGLEEGEHSGLGWLQGEVSRINPANKDYKIPHMGWNELIELKDNALTKGLNQKDFYFVHSYSMKTERNNIIATADYAEEIVAVVNKENIYGTQFHPEKSQENGLKLLSNFINI